MKEFPMQIQNFGVIFVEMQRIRHRADYDPHADFEEALAKHFVDGIIERVRRTIEDFNVTNEKDRKAFCVYILFKTRP